MSGKAKKAAEVNGLNSVMSSMNEFGPAEGGLTKREYFAAMAMQGLVASNTDYNTVAKWAVDHADALLLALEEVKP